eukprot:GHRQ01001564.1.p2 GENE.GHRQ01001564.1~~GHRQ01001564.1.p2  ORF type:complete len:114 (+),score=22.22 GHRQ01001564.1:254-595(+)
MTGALRRASASVLQRLGSSRAQASALGRQTRNGHDTAVHKNKYVEQWLSRREDIEREFRWTSKTLRDVVIGVLVIPVAMYNGIVWAAHTDDEYGERPVRDFLWAHAQPGERSS